MARQANVTHLVSKLKFKIADEPRKLRNVDGPAGRIKKIQKTLTALIKYERIELNYYRADETRGYAELLIDEAIRHGPANKETMELADFYILEKQYVHKLFKVLVPRFENYSDSYTKLYTAPSSYPDACYRRGVLELKGNIYPSLNFDNPNTKYMLHNILLSAAKKDYRTEKYKEIADKMEH